MTHTYDDPARLRADDDEFDGELSRLADGGSSGALAVAARTVSGGSYPASAQRYYKLEVYTVTGTETEGGTATETATGSYVYAFNIGNAVPTAGTRVLAVFAGYRWEFSYS